ncbi:methylation-associated defense system DNA methyltransferase MAD2 [Flavobacterium caseinilyticum]|uniref:N-6 DNA methylase n=1 Tax=Flavobacterium caseinilyticum TaxID=2541732 RepID=A0A4R5AT42_9FLAO|nr:N-6 DNA methylase [Flavobacterium caseinilyticum]TDD74856.1 N-6 DNA methylase [Flavobacterium caseinilyticum]
MSSEEIILEDNQLVCILTNKHKKATSQEKSIQSIIRMLNEEYDFDLKNIDRDVNITFTDPDTGKVKKQKIEVVIYEENSKRNQEDITRIGIVQDEKIKDNDNKKGVTITLENALAALDNCEFGLWTNGNDLKYLQKEDDEYNFDFKFSDLADIPGYGETIEDLDRADRSNSRKPANDSLIKVFKRSHDYIYGNEGRKKDAFWQLLYLIFCKLYDEKRRFICIEKGESYRRKFWVGIKEKNSDAGRKNVAKRIKDIFEELKQEGTFSDVFDGNEAIDLTDKGIAFIAGELAKYSFLDATVDVKGMAYETIVSNTLKQEAGQFFTPRNIVKAMVEMLNPNENTRVLDPACGSGGFLVLVLDHVRKQIAKKMYPDLEDVLLAEKFNTYEVNEKVRQYAETNIFGFDFDPDLKKAARMNMVMAGDGHANIFHVNSLAYPKWEHPSEIEKINLAINNSLAKMKDIDSNYTNDARGKFDMIFTNPPFGAKVKVEQEIAEKYFLSKYSDAPEILFIEACYDFLKPGGKMAIVLPDGILGNPNTFPVREWILENFKILASVDLPVEAFLPQVGVQASLLFLEKKTDLDKNIAHESDEDYDVFMAIAEKLGKDRRGNPVYIRDEEGAEMLFTIENKYVSTSKDGTQEVKSRVEKQKMVDDDLPKIVSAFLSNSK